jgi:hypothetical protein
MPYVLGSLQGRTRIPFGVDPHFAANPVAPHGPAVSHTNDLRIVVLRQSQKSCPPLHDGSQRGSHDCDDDHQGHYGKPNARKPHGLTSGSVDARQWLDLSQNSADNQGSIKAIIVGCQARKHSLRPFMFKGADCGFALFSVAMFEEQVIPTPDEIRATVARVREQTAGMDLCLDATINDYPSRVQP